MKTIMTMAVALMMVFAFGISLGNAQQEDTAGTNCPIPTKADGRMTPKAGWPTMAKAGNFKCAMGIDAKGLTAAGRCPLPSHPDARSEGVSEKAEQSPQQ